MTLTQRFLDQILLNIDKHQAALIKNESKKLVHLGNTDFNDLNQNQKNLVLKTIDKFLNNNYKLLNSDLDNFFNKDNIPTILNISVVNDTQGCRYYRQFTKEDYSNFLEQLKIAKDNYFSEIYIKKYKKKLFKRKF